MAYGWKKVYIRLRQNFLPGENKFLYGKKFGANRLEINFFAGRNFLPTVCNFSASRYAGNQLLINI